jgi:predicted nucleic acid-binding protein
MPQPGLVVIDACSLQSFATVDRLDLLESRFAGRVTWTRAVQIEVKRGIQRANCLEKVGLCTWLGEPVDLPTDDMLTYLQLDELRQALGGTNAKPTEHLGEAETIHYIETVAPSAIFVTDDRSAMDFAGNRGIAVMNSAAVLRECYIHDEIGCPDAYQLLLAMSECGRGVSVPLSHDEVC